MTQKRQNQSKRLSNAIQDFLNQDGAAHSHSSAHRAINCLRDNFGESLKIVSEGSQTEEFLTQKVTFSVVDGKFNAILSVVELRADINFLIKRDENSLPSITLHTLTLNEALIMMGFDIGAVGTSLSPDSSKRTESNKPATTPKANSTTPVAKPTLVAKPKEQPAPQTEAQNEKIKPEPTTQKTTQILDEVPAETSRSEELAKTIEAHSHINDDEPTTISSQLKNKIIGKMRELDLSEEAVLSRLRKTDAKSIHDLSPDEGYRINQWLTTSQIDSTDVVKKRNRLGGFNASPSTPPADTTNTKATAQGKETQATAQGNTKAKATTPETITLEKFLKEYNREVALNHDSVAMAVIAIQEVTGISTQPDDVTALLGELSASELRDVRNLFLSKILMM